jgi:ABC-type uncharacterized transport system involved in gliding motility auxiliary subunit
MAAERSESQRVLIEGGTLSLGVVMALLLYGMFNYLATRHYARFDWTSSRLYSLSDKSLAVLAGLDREIDAVLFFADPSSELYSQVDELLSRYEAASPAFFNKRVVDPVKSRLQAQQLVDRYNIERNNVIVLAAGDDRRVIDEVDLAEYDYSGVQLGQSPSLKGFKGEQLITSAVLELVEAEKPKILFTTGHGESSLDGGGDPRSLSEARRLLGRDNFELEAWDSARALEVPADADLLVIAGPQTNFFAPELETISRYLEGGGRVLALIDPIIDGAEVSDAGLGAWLARYGVEIGANVVIDPETQLLFYGPESVYTDSYGFHPIVEDLDQTKSRVLFRVARTVKKADDAPARFTVDELVKTSSAAWGETDLADLENLRADEGEVQGALALGVAVTFAVARVGSGEDEVDETAPEGAAEAEEARIDEDEDEDEDEEREPEARLVVYGDLDFAADSQIVQAANGNLLLNTFNWLVQREQLISIEARKPEETRLDLAASELSTIYFLILLVMPGLAVAAGVTVFLRRRR